MHKAPTCPALISSSSRRGPAIVRCRRKCKCHGCLIIGGGTVAGCGVRWLIVSASFPMIGKERVCECAAAPHCAELCRRLAAPRVLSTEDWPGAHRDCEALSSRRSLGESVVHRLPADLCRALPAQVSWCCNIVRRKKVSQFPGSQRASHCAGIPSF